MMKGKEILQKNYPNDELRMRIYMDVQKQEIAGLQKAIAKFNTKIEVFEAELKRCENMTLTEWLNEHPNKKGA